MERLVKNFEQIKDFYEPLMMEYLFNSILEGFTSAKFYVNDINKPSLSMVVQDKAVYFGGQVQEEKVYHEVIDYFINNVLVKSIESGMYFLKAIYTTDEWAQALKKELLNQEYKVFPRLLFNHSLKNIPNHQANDQGVQLLNINKDIVDRQLENTDDLVDEITGEWMSIDNFYNHGFGICAVKDDRIIGWCTAEYMSDKSCGIGIETIEEYMGKNIASSMTCEFLKICKQKSLIPHWDSWVWNEASVKVAEKCGFEQIKQYDAMMMKLR